MVAEIRLYFEGDRSLRLGFNAFLKSAIDLMRQRGVRFQAVAGYSTDETIRDFLDAIQDYHDAFVILLVDSDRPDNHNLVASVKSLSSWDTHVGRGVEDDQIHFMVQVMESWFLADKDTLAAYYGRGFLSRRLPQNTNVEQIPKGDVITSLENATRSTSKKKYHKTRHAPDLLSVIDASRVRRAAPNCDRLFTTLEHLISNT